MKKSFRKLIKDYLRVSFLQTRDTLHLTQEQMADRLLMSTRAYAKLETGHSCCSLFTALIFLSRCCTDRRAFLEGLFKLLDSFDFPRADFFPFSPTFSTLQIFLPLQLYFLYSFLTISFFHFPP